MRFSVKTYLMVCGIFGLASNPALSGPREVTYPKKFLHVRPAPQKVAKIKVMARRAGVNFVASYPPSAVPGGTYTVKPGEERLYIADLYLPRNFTLNVDPSIKQIVWTVDSINAENGAMFDLSASQTKPAKPSKTPPRPQETYCVYGKDGHQGTHGTNGASGTSLNMTVLGLINRGGLLWLVSDGGPGGDGGDGQDGQQGGGPRRLTFHFCRAAHGGNPGPKGPPGAGGPPGDIAVTIGGSQLPSGVAPTCGRSARPNASPSSVLAISRGPGCAGNSGQPGAHGKPG